MSTNSMIDMKGIRKVYRTGKVEVEALRGVDIDLKPGEFVSIVGPSGSGKSTLMNICGCLDTPTAGEYLLDGERVDGFDSNRLAEVRNHKVGFVFQNFNLLPYATAYENIEMPLIFAGLPARKRKPRVLELLDRVGLADRADHKPAELSGGEMQRVAIARSLANHPKLVLADEPTGNLDTRSGQQIIDIFEELWNAGTTIMIITHDRNIAKRTMRTVLLKDGLVTDSLNGNGNG